MKYLLINGSPHKGNTWKLAELARAVIQKKDTLAEFEEIHLADVCLPFCRGCSACFRLGPEKCPHRDVMGEILQKIDKADGVIVASTTYNMRETAMLKNFFDHLCYLEHRPYFFRSKALVITSTGGVGATASAKSIASFLKAIGFNRCYRFSAVTCSWNAYQVDKKTAAKLDRTAGTFCQDVLSKKLHSPSSLVMIPYNLFRGMSLAYAPGTEFETQDGLFWTEETRRKSTYDSAVPVPFYKKLFGSLFYLIGRTAGKKIVVTYKK